MSNRPVILIIARPITFDNPSPCEARSTHEKDTLDVAAIFVMMLGVAIQTTHAQEDAGRLIKQLEEDSDRFSNSVTKALDNSRFDGTSTEDQLIRYVRDYEDAIDRLKKGWDKGQDPTFLVKEVQTRSKAIDKFLKKYPLGSNVATDWGTVKSVLLRLKNTRMFKTS